VSHQWKRERTSVLWYQVLNLNATDDPTYGDQNGSADTIGLTFERARGQSPAVVKKNPRLQTMRLPLKPALRLRTRRGTIDAYVPAPQSHRHEARET
jgi:hypothetical protein